MRTALVLGLVALTAFAPMQSGSTQDETRLALTRALVTQGTTRIDSWHRTEDRAIYGGHYYTDKAPGTSLLAIPAYGIERAVGGEASPWRGRWSRWLMRLLVNGPLLLAITLLVAHRGGLFVGVLAALGTMLGALASVLFSHLGAAALGFGAFVVRRKPGLAGVLAGSAVVVEYQSSIVLVVVGCLVGVRGLRRFALGALPPLAVLAVYDWWSFGSPFHVSYHYVDNAFGNEQRSGLFGIGAPTLQAIRSVLVGGSGLRVGRGVLVTTPVLVGSLVGAVLIWRRGLRSEVAAVAVVCAAYLLFDAGYFLPYGGISPGPRFLAPALPFAVLPFAAFYERWRRAAIALGTLSVITSTQILLAWFWNDSWLDRVPPPTIWSALGLSRSAGVALVFTTALLAVAASLAPPPRRRQRL